MKRQSGFTLVEILVVIAIIAAVISILLPALARSRQIAYRITCLNNLKQLGLAIESYVQAYGYYPVCVPSDTNERWNDFLADKSIAAKKMLGVPVSLWPFHETASLYNCPILDRAGCDISYCYNWLAGRVLDGTEVFAAAVPSDIRPTPVEKKKTEFRLLSPKQVKEPARFVLLYDLPVKPQQSKTGPSDIDLYKDIDPDDYESSSSGPNGEDFLGFYNSIPTEGPHSYGYDILFADGHVKWYKRWSESSMSRKPF